MADGSRVGHPPVCIADQWVPSMALGVKCFKCTCVKSWLQRLADWCNFDHLQRCWFFTQHSIRISSSELPALLFCAAFIDSDKPRRKWLRLFEPCFERREQLDHPKRFMGAQASSESSRTPPFHCLGFLHLKIFFGTWAISLKNWQPLRSEVDRFSSRHLIRARCEDFPVSSRQPLQPTFRVAARVLRPLPPHRQV
jgi:hypothetical protein